ncbi:MAG: hypothetical protein A2079_06020 [Geobacteraceae bacterium GWC2_48_7]|nr:MAG: hypothetical protein A2079_06020 [Geobacteraceae bacterium GWC2_48_7]
MNKQQLIEKTTEILRPLETANLVNTVQNLTLHQIVSNPVIILTIALFFFMGVIRKSRPVLFMLFALMVVILLLRFAMPTPGTSLTIMETLPLFGGAILVGGVLLYYTFIKID